MERLSGAGGWVGSTSPLPSSSEADASCLSTWSESCGALSSISFVDMPSSRSVAPGLIEIEPETSTGPSWCCSGCNSVSSLICNSLMWLSSDFELISEGCGLFGIFLGVDLQEGTRRNLGSQCISDREDDCIEKGTMPASELAFLRTGSSVNDLWRDSAGPMSAAATGSSPEYCTALTGFAWSGASSDGASGALDSLELNKGFLSKVTNSYWRVMAFLTLEDISVHESSPTLGSVAPWG